MLTEENRSKLDNIVSQMINNKETDENIQAVVNDFKNKYDIPEQTQKQSQLPNALKELTSAYSLNPKRVGTMASSPAELKKGLGASLLAGQIAGGSIMPSLATAKFGAQGIAKILPYIASGLTTTPTTQYGIEKLKGAVTPEALKSAGLSAIGDIGGSSILGGLSKVRPTIANLLAGVPKKSTETAIQSARAGENIFKNSPDYENMAIQTQKEMNKMTKESGELVGQAKEKMKNLNIANLDISDIKDFVDKTFQSTINKKLGSSLSNEAIENINEILNDLDKLKDTADVEDLFFMRDKINELSNFKKAGLVKISDKEDTLFRNIGAKIREKIDNIADNFNIPELKEANKKYSTAIKLKEDLMPILSKDPTVAEKLYDIAQKITKENKPVVSYSKELEALSPELQKKYTEAIAQENLNQTFPIGHNRQETLKWLTGLGVGGAALGHNANSLATLGAIPLMSPLTYKGLSKLSNPLISNPIKQGTKQATIRTIANLLNNNGGQNGNT